MLHDMPASCAGCSCTNSRCRPRLRGSFSFPAASNAGGSEKRDAYPGYSRAEPFAGDPGMGRTVRSAPRFVMKRQQAISSHVPRLHMKSLRRTFSSCSSGNAAQANFALITLESGDGHCNVVTQNPTDNYVQWPNFIALSAYTTSTIRRTCCICGNRYKSCHITKRHNGCSESAG